MEFVSIEDCYELVNGSIISDIDLDVVIELYQPIVGYRAVSVYLLLAKDVEKSKIHEINSQENLLNRLQMTANDFMSGKNALEAVGLLKSYIKKNKIDGKRVLVYKIYSPKAPNDFFDDVLFKGMLVKYIGEDETLKLVNKFAANIDNDEMIETTSSFNDVFKLDYSDKAFLTKINQKTLRRKSNNFKTSFDFEKFFKICSIKNSGLTKESLYKKDIHEIDRISALFSLNEDEMAEIVCPNFDKNKDKGSRIDFEKVLYFANQDSRYQLLQKKPGSNKTVLNANTMLAKKVELMESLSPVEYLRLKQNNTKPALADVKIINDISRDYCLNNGVINTLVDFVLTTQNNKLPRSYIETIAASIAREGIENTLDAMNYLNKTSSKKTVEKNVKICTEEESDSSLTDFLKQVAEAERGRLYGKN